MAVITSQKISDYYERFKTISVTFTREIIGVTGLLAEQVHLKCMSDFWPCVIYSSSFEAAKIAVSLKSGILVKLRQSNSSVSLRFCFKDDDNKTPLTFFVSARVLGHTPQGLSADIGLFSLQFTQRPPDTLVGIIGRILDANINFTKRRDERIPVAAETMKRLALLSPETAVFIQGVPRRCILRDLSFSGAKVIIMGVAKFLENREVSLRVDFDEPRASFLLKGSFSRSEIVEGRQDLVAMVLEFTEAAIPLGYKLRLSDYLNQVKIPEKKPSPGAASHA